MDDLPQKHRVGELFTYAREHVGPEVGGHGVRDVEAPACDAAAQPVQHDLHHGVAHSIFTMVQGGQLAVALPVRVAGQALLNPRVRAGDVVEHSVQHDVDAAGTAFVDKPGEVLLIAEAGVDAEVVEGVVAVGGGGEDGAEQKAVAAEFHQVVQPRLEGAEARGGVVLLADRRAEGGQRVDVPPDCAVQHGLEPTHRATPRARPRHHPGGGRRGCRW